MSGLKKTSGKDELYRRMVADFECLLVDIERGNQQVDFVSSVAVDLGSGIGALSEALSRRTRSVISIEPSCEDLTFQQLIHKKTGSDIAHVSSIEDVRGTKLANEAEILFAWHVIEHLENPIGVLQSARKIFPNLKYVFGSVPALHPRNISEEHDILLQEFTLRKWLALAGFKIMNIDYVNVMAFINFTAVPLEEGRRIHALKCVSSNALLLEELLLMQLFRSGADISILQGCIDTLEYKLSGCIDET